MITFRDVIGAIGIMIITCSITIISFQMGVSDGKKQDRLLSNEENRTTLKSLRNTITGLKDLITICRLR